MRRGSRSEYDVVIVGGGPAGAAAAIVAASGGLRVCILEARTNPSGYDGAGMERRRERPGETLHPGLGTVFKALGVDEAVDRASSARHAGHMVAWNGKAPTFVPFGSESNGSCWLGYQVRRCLLERILLRRAEEVGAAVEFGCTALELLRTADGRIAGVEGGRGPRLGSFVFDASGGRHWLTRRLDVAPARVSRPLVACFGWHEEATGASRRSAMADARPLLRAGRHGWAWTASLGDGRVAWVDVAFDPAGRRRGAPWTPSKRPEDFGAADVTWRRAPQVSGPGFLVVGDAASVIDPASSRGVLRAVMTGAVAAHCAADVLQSSANEDVVMARYARWHGDWFAHDVATLADLYERLGPRTWQPTGAAHVTAARPFAGTS